MQVEPPSKGGNQRTQEEHPLIFSSDMVQAILEERKRKTRRVAKRSPLWRVGDTIWVREAFALCPDVVYRADGATIPPGSRWRSPIFMPRSLARITLEIVWVHAERLHEITKEEILAEGVQLDVTEDGCPSGFAKPLIRLSGKPAPYEYLTGISNPTADDILRANFAAGWDALNGKRDGGAYAWAKNPLVWVIEFRIVA